MSTYMGISRELSETLNKKCVLSDAVLSSGQIKNTIYQHFKWNSSIFDSVACE